MTQLAKMKASATSATREQDDGSAERYDGATSAKVPPKLFVLDTTAIAGTAPGRGPRTHELIVAEDHGHKIIKSYTFEPSKPLELDFPIAVKFLRIPSFKRTNEQGDVQPYHRQPKQPHELVPGERFELTDHQTVADYGELSNMALRQRVLELPGGEALPDKGSRQALIDFIVKTTVAQRRANSVKEVREVAPGIDLTDIDPIEE